jgi:glycosyltransferase 2 family protein
VGTQEHKGGGWKGAARPIVAIVLLALVAWFLPWKDRLVLTRDGEVTQVAGDIAGDWRGDSIEFRVGAEEQLDGTWPEAVRAAHAARASMPVVRDAAAEANPAGRTFLTWRPGMVRVFSELDPRGLALAMAMFVLAALTSITRWWRLLAIASCPTTWWNAFRLTFLGFFFNLVIPGLTGGDVIKAVLVVRENPKRRADALMSVIVDRVLGLLVLVGLAVVAVWASGDRFRDIELWGKHFDLKVWVTVPFGVAILAIAAVLHPWPRRALRADRLLERLPQRERIRALDRALRLYSKHPLEMGFATLLSVANHACIAGGVYVIGRAFGGNQLEPLEYVAVVALANVISSLPMTPGGWGVGEVIFGALFHVLGAPTTLGIAVSITYRLLVTALNLSGGAFLLVPGGRQLREQGEQLAAQATAEAPAE